MEPLRGALKEDHGMNPGLFCDFLLLPSSFINGLLCRAPQAKHADKGPKQKRCPILNLHDHETKQSFSLHKLIASGTSL